MANKQHSPGKKRRASSARRRRPSAKIRREIRQDLEAYNAYVAAHGSPAALARAHYRNGDHKR